MKLLTKLTTLLLSVLFNYSWGQNLTIQDKGSLILENQSKLILHNSDWVNNGAFFMKGDSSVLLFTGKENNIISGNRTSVFTNLHIEKSGEGQLELQQSIFVDRAIDFQKGLLNIKDHHVTLDSDATLLNEHDQSRIFTPDSGTVSISVHPQNNKNINPGNLGFEFSSSVQPGTVTVIRGHKPLITPPDGTGIFRFYEINTDISGGFDTVRFRYFPSELNGVKDPEIKILTRNPNSDWKTSTKQSHNPQQNYLEVIGVDSINLWTAASQLNVLPVIFEGIASRCVTSSFELSFTPGNESNIDHFRILKSKDGWNWKMAGTIASSQEESGLNYLFTDDSPKNFYRIEAIEINGNKILSPTLQNQCLEKESSISIYPNPFKDYIHLSLSKENKNAKMVIIYNVLGNQVFSKNLSNNARNQNQTINTSHLDPGLYTIAIAQSNGKILNNFKLIKE